MMIALDIPFSSFRKHSMEKTLRELEAFHKPLIMEVGRTRHSDGMEGDVYSTIHFAEHAMAHGGTLVSIDSDSNTEPLCKSLLDLVGLGEASVTFVNVAPNQFYVPDVNDIALLYLDGPDCVEPWEELSAEWHLSCIKFLEPRVCLGGLVLVDDCFSMKTPLGKGKKAIPYLVDVGYEVLFEGYQWLLRKSS